MNYSKQVRQLSTYLSLTYWRYILYVIVDIYWSVGSVNILIAVKCPNISTTTWTVERIVIKLRVTYHVTGSVVSLSTHRVRYYDVKCQHLLLLRRRDVILFDKTSLSHLRLHHLQAFVATQIGAIALPSTPRFSAIKYDYWTQWCSRDGSQWNALVPATATALQSTVREKLGLSPANRACFNATFYTVLAHKNPPATECGSLQMLENSNNDDDDDNNNKRLIPDVVCIASPCSRFGVFCTYFMRKAFNFLPVLSAK